MVSSVRFGKDLETRISPRQAAILSGIYREAGGKGVVTQALPLLGMHGLSPNPPDDEVIQAIEARLLQCIPPQARTKVSAQLQQDPVSSLYAFRTWLGNIYEGVRGHLEQIGRSRGSRILTLRDAVQWLQHRKLTHQLNDHRLLSDRKLLEQLEPVLTPLYQLGETDSASTAEFIQTLLSLNDPQPISEAAKQLIEPHPLAVIRKLTPEIMMERLIQAAGDRKTLVRFINAFWCKNLPEQQVSNLDTDEELIAKVVSVVSNEPLLGIVPPQLAGGSVREIPVEKLDRLLQMGVITGKQHKKLGLLRELQSRWHNLLTKSQQETDPEKQRTANLTEQTATVLQLLRLERCILQNRDLWLGIEGIQSPAAFFQLQNLQWLTPGVALPHPNVVQRELPEIQIQALPSGESPEGAAGTARRAVILGPDWKI